MGDVLRNARSIARNIDLSDDCRATILDSGDKLLTYLFSNGNNDDDDDGSGGGGSGSVAVGGGGNGSGSVAVGGGGSNAMEDVPDATDATEVVTSSGVSSVGHSVSTAASSSQ